MGEMRFCICDKQDLAVVVYISGDASDTKHTVAITCTICHHPVFVELRSLVESEDIPMRLDRENDGNDIVYKLRAEAEQ